MPPMSELLVVTLAREAETNRAGVVLLTMDQALGLPGQLLALAVCVIVAGLPVTGFLLWWNRGRRFPAISAPARSGNDIALSGGDARTAPLTYPAITRPIVGRVTVKGAPGS